MTRVTAVSGSLRAPSSTTALLEAIVDGFAEHLPVEPSVIELSPLAVDLAVAVTGGEASVPLGSALEQVGATDLLIVGTPVYRGSYTGLFKQFFDLVGQNALVGTPVLLAAGGGNDLHSLAIDQELRPLFSFFGALTLPLGVYARSADYVDRAVASEGLRGQIDRAVEAGLPWIAARNGHLAAVNGR